MLSKKLKPKREPSYNAHFILTGLIVLLVVLLVIGVAKFASVKTLFWLE